MCFYNIDLVCFIIFCSFTPPTKIHLKVSKFTWNLSFPRDDANKGCTAKPFSSAQQTPPTQPNPKSIIFKFLEQLVRALLRRERSCCSGSGCCCSHLGCWRLGCIGLCWQRAFHRFDFSCSLGCCYCWSLWLVDLCSGWT